MCACGMTMLVRGDFSPAPTPCILLLATLTLPPDAHEANHQHVNVLPDSDAARYSCIQAKLEATESGPQLLIGEVGSGLAGELLPGLRGAVFEGGRRACLRGGGLLYVRATILCIRYLQHLRHTLLLSSLCPPLAVLSWLTHLACRILLESQRNQCLDKCWLSEQMTDLTCAESGGL